jgi:hypothetical protein
LPGGAPYYFGILWNDIQQVNCLEDSEGWIEAPRQVVIGSGYAGYNFGTGGAHTMNIAEYFAQQRVFVVCFCCITDAYQATSMFNKCAQGLFSFHIQRTYISINHYNAVQFEII